METQEVKVGDTVALKSGGHLMSIGDQDGILMYCYWFDKEGNFHHERIPIHCLKKAENASSFGYYID